MEFRGIRELRSNGTIRIHHFRHEKRDPYH